MFIAIATAVVVAILRVSSFLLVPMLSVSAFFLVPVLLVPIVASPAQRTRIFVAIVVF